MNPGNRTSVVGIVVLLAYVAFFTAMLVPSNSEALNIDPRHPRMFVCADSVETLRARFGPGGPGHDLFLLYKHWVDSHWDDASPYYLDDYAMIYLLSQNDAYGDHAVNVAMQAVASGTGVRMGQEGYGPATSSSICIAYDWCYDHFTPSQRETIREAIYDNINDGNYGPRAWQPHDKNWHYMLCVAGDYDEPSKNAVVLGKLEESIDRLDNFYIGCMDDLRPEGALDGYSWQKLKFLFLLRDCLIHSSDYSGPSLHSTFLAASPNHWMHRMRPDYHPHRAPGKYNPKFYAPNYMAFFSNRLGYRYGQTVVNQTMEWMSNNVMPYFGRDLMLWYIPGLPTAPLEELPLEYYDPQMGWFIARSGWNLGDHSNDIQFFVTNSPNTEYGQGRAQGHFTITRGSDNLLIDSGRYGRDDDDCFRAYYIRSIAHNTLLVYDPDEDYGHHTNTYGHSIPMPNDGGQNWFDTNCGGAGNPWPRCRTQDGNIGVACRGTIEYPMTISDQLIVIDCDATVSYWPEKVSKVVRKFTYRRPDWVFIQDCVVLRKPDLPVRVVFHSVDRPSVNGDLVALEGVLSQGGVFQSTDTDIVTINDGNSSARLYVLSVEGGADEIRLVGGPNRHGLHWKQNIEPNDSYSYVSNIADQSFEFYVDGKNYAPGGRDEEYLRDHRNDPGPDVAGDWRVEHLIEHPLGDVVRTAYAIHITELGAPIADVEAISDGDVILVSVENGPQTFKLGLCPADETCTHISH